MEHARHPRGAPTGGQFAATPHPEGGVLTEGAPAAQVHGEISSYAVGLAADARRAEDEASTQVSQHSSNAQELADKAEALREKAKDRGKLGRWSSTRKAKKADKSAADLRALAAKAKEAASEANSEAGRIQAGVDAERAVVEALTRTPGVRHVLCGLNLGPGIGDIDVIAVGDVVVIAEVKAGRGELHANPDGTVTHGGRMTPKNPLTQCARQVTALRTNCGVAAIGCVVFPDAEPRALRHPQTGCYLVGGVDKLTTGVSKWMSESTAGPQNAKQIVLGVQNALNARHQEIVGWIDSIKSQNDAAYDRINRWQQKIAQSSGWSKGPEIRSNLTRMIAENRGEIAEREEKRSNFANLAAAVTDAWQENQEKLIDKPSHRGR